MPRCIPCQVITAGISADATPRSPPLDETAKCSLVQCTYCQQVRAKNTTRQKQHLLQCAPYLQQHGHDVALQAQAASASTAPAPQGHPHPPPPPAINDAPRAPHAPHMPHPPPVAPMYGHDDSAIEHTNLSFMPNPRINGMVIETPPSQPQPPQSQPQPPPSQPQPPPSQPRPSLGANGAPAAKKQKTKPSTDSSIEIPLKDVHASFEEFRAKPDDKCLSSRCKYCNQVRAKNTSRQREHLLICVGYQAVLKEKIPANNLLHQFDADDVASSLALPAPSFDLDFRMSIRTKPKLNIGAGTAGQQSWISCIGGQWAGSWGKGILLVGYPLSSCLLPAFPPYPFFSPFPFFSLSLSLPTSLPFSILFSSLFPSSFALYSPSYSPPISHSISSFAPLPFSRYFLILFLCFSLPVSQLLPLTLSRPADKTPKQQSRTQPRASTPATSCKPTTSIPP